MKLVLASNNKHKLRELKAILPSHLELCTAPDFNIDAPAETGSTFVENAIIKARHACEITGLPAIADDSGLAVDHLSGAPGIFSSRYAGDNASDADNNSKLLKALSGVIDTNRGARFHSVIVFLRHAQTPMPLIAQGTWEGSILKSPQGNSGFGYDPIFFIPDLNQSAAQLDAGTKNRLSHRGQALQRLNRLLGAAVFAAQA